ncbi:MAG TPA: hypothetical protein VEI01_24835 [Terriglobales bacterium]|nr:hypothetical protein [Terriglobales bacterium]
MKAIVAQELETNLRIEVDTSVHQDAGHTQHPENGQTRPPAYTSFRPATSTLLINGHLKPVASVRMGFLNRGPRVGCTRFEEPMA